MLSVRTGMRAIFNQYKNALFVLGGKSEVKGSVLRSVESFDSRSGQWNKWADMIYGRTFFGCVILPSNDILCVGGKKSNEYQTTCEILDIPHALHKITHYPPPRLSASLTCLHCLSILVFFKQSKI